MRTTNATQLGGTETGDPGSVRAEPTPGPYAVDSAPYPEKFHIRRNDARCPTLIAHVNRLAGNEDIANAHLLAASWEMLKALRNSADALQFCLNEYVPADCIFRPKIERNLADNRAAIAKATGSAA